MDANNLSESYLQNFDDSGLHDFINEANFDQFIDLIRGEFENPEICYNAEYGNYEQLVNGAAVMVDNQFGSGPNPPSVDVHGFNYANSTAISDPNLFLDSLPSIDVVDMKEIGGEEDDGNDSSGTTTTTNTPTNKSKVDRSRTLISERRRRGRMKEKLYALRSLVPYITKMDKASIVGDAVLYIQELQIQARNLRTEIAGLELSIINQGSNEKPQKVHARCNNHTPVCRKIVQMDVFQVEERGFYVRLVSHRGEGIAAYLYKAIESLDGFNVQSSNLATVSDKFVLTFTLNVSECGEDMNLPNLKLWITGALLNQGFDIKLSA